MQVTGLTLSQFHSCVSYVSQTKYGGNVIVHQDAHDREPYKNGTPQCTARLTTLSNDGPGTRTARNGRHGKYACWHAYRDVLAEVFHLYPNAVIRAGLAWRVTYRGQAGFLATYPETAHYQMGSEAYPVTMPELCECTDSDAFGSQQFGHEFQFPRRLPRLGPTLAERTGLEPLARNDQTWEFEPVATWQIASRYDNPDYVSPAVAHAARVQAESAKLLDDHIDEIVFGPIEIGLLQHSNEF